MVAFWVGRSLFHAGKKYGPRAIPYVRAFVVSRARGAVVDQPRKHITHRVEDMYFDAIKNDAPYGGPMRDYSFATVSHSNEYGVIENDKRSAIPYLR